MSGRLGRLAGVGHHLRQPALWRWLAVLPLAAVVVLTAPATAAQAHPMGPPQQVSFSLVAPDQVQVNWKAGAPDDLSWLAYDLGLLPADRIMLDGAITPQSDDVELLQNSPALADYLTRRISVRSGGQDCSAGRPEISELSNAGATVVFSCPAQVRQATIELGLLTDLEASYATIATGPDGTQAVYNGHVTSQEWTFDPDSAPQPAVTATSAFTLGWLPGAGLATALLVGAGGLAWWLNGRKRKQAIS